MKYIIVELQQCFAYIRRKNTQGVVQLGSPQIMGLHTSKSCFDYDNETPNKKKTSKPNFNILIFQLGKKSNLTSLNFTLFCIQILIPLIYESESE